MFLRRGIKLASVVCPHFVLNASNIRCKATTTIPDLYHSAHVAHYTDVKHQPDSYDIELVDNDAWHVSSGLALADQGMEGTALEGNYLSDGMIDESTENCSLPGFEGDPDFDDIDNMRVRGALFFKIDRDSKEFEEYSFDFHGRKKSSNKNVNGDPKEGRRKDSGLKKSKKENPILNFASRSVKQSETVNDTQLVAKDSTFIKKKKKLRTPTDNQLVEKDSTSFEKKKLRTPTHNQLVEKVSTSVVKKNLRTPTYNQLTGPFHEPFCLDIYISKASIRACIVHRVTSKVVAVAHSISKDMKYDLGSTKNAAACNAVGAVLAQRALGDDIHDVIYTPRRGEKVEGKLQVVLRSLIDNGINVKVKIKQRMPKKHSSSCAAGM